MDSYEEYEKYGELQQLLQAAVQSHPLKNFFQ